MENCELHDAEELQPWWAADLDLIQRGGGVPSLEYPEDYVQPQACTLLMGDLSAVFAAQLAHLNNLASHGVGEGAGCLDSDVGFPRGPVLSAELDKGRLLEEVLSLH